MKHLPMMTEDEIQYVCSVIPDKDAVLYFQRNPKEFAKICPGFRPNAVTKLDVGNLIFRNRSRGFIEYFIENHISDWLVQIQEHIEKCMKDGDSKLIALLKTLPHCYFIDNISLYFKLTGEECAEESIAILDASVKIIKDSAVECERLETALSNKGTESSRLEAEIERTKDEQNRTNIKLSECLDGLKHHIIVDIDLRDSKKALASLEDTIADLKQKEQERTGCIKQLREDLATAKNEQLHLELKIREELTKQQAIERHKCDAAQTPKRPKDLDEFKDYLGYNFESIGVPSGEDYLPLLKDHVSDILFQGNPIIISKSTGLSLLRCISNTLVKTPAVAVLAFSTETTEETIDSFLAQDKRVLCLDNFIGNYNETMLITTCKKYKGKIIFLTVAFDHTLAYVPDELLRYCHYLNLNRIKAFSEEKELTEDPSVMDEEDVAVNYVVSDNRWSTILKEILRELGFCGALPVYKSSIVVDELHLCRLLAFDILPYCIDVLKIAPFNTSERLFKYAGNNGRCPYKDLFIRWFS